MVGEKKKRKVPENLQSSTNLKGGESADDDRFTRRAQQRVTEMIRKKKGCSAYGRKKMNARGRRQPIKNMADVQFSAGQEKEGQGNRA